MKQRFVLTQMEFVFLLFKSPVCWNLGRSLKVPFHKALINLLRVLVLLCNF